MQNKNTSPSIYVACLASYNDGVLYGRWIDATQSAEQINLEIADMLKASPVPFAEEWAVHDYDGFGTIRLSEWPNIARVAKIAELIEEHGDGFALWYNDQGGHDIDLAEMEDDFLSKWQGAHDSREAFVDHLFETTGQLEGIPEWARNYFDYHAYARDLELSGDYSFVQNEGQYYVYSSY